MNQNLIRPVNGERQCSLLATNLLNICEVVGSIITIAGTDRVFDCNIKHPLNAVDIGCLYVVTSIE